LNTFSLPREMSQGPPRLRDPEPSAAISPEMSTYLDLVRFSAALVVFFSHTCDVTAGLLWQFRPHGVEAVVVFFVLSGFVVRHVSATRETSARSYAVSRLARLYSVVWLVVPVTLVADAIWKAARPALYAGWTTDTSPWDVLGCLAFLNQLWGVRLQIGSDGPYWSLGFEAWYYLMLGLVLFLPGRWRAVGVAVAAVIAGPRILLALPMWLVGVGCWEIVCGRRRSWLSRIGRVMGVAMALAPLPLYLVLRSHRGDAYNLFVPFEATQRAAWTFVYFQAIALLFATQLIGIAVITKTFARMARRVGPLVRWLAGATFTLYLLHVPIAWSLAAISPWPASDWHNRLLVVGGTLLAILLLAEIGERRKQTWHQLFGALIPLRGIAPAAPSGRHGAASARGRE
jgi:peptidoglycan/LPS O-acetylase OafA/YrhL